MKLPPDVFIIRRFQKNAKVGPRSGKVEREKSSQVPDRKSTSKDKPQLLNIKITQNGSKSFELPNPPTKTQFDLGFCAFFFLAPKKKVGCEKKSGAFGATMAAPKLMRSDTKGSRLSLSSAASNIDVSEIGAPWALEKSIFSGVWLRIWGGKFVLKCYF